LLVIKSALELSGKSTLLLTNATKKSHLKSKNPTQEILNSTTKPKYSNFSTEMEKQMTEESSKFTNTLLKDKKILWL